MPKAKRPENELRQVAIRLVEEPPLLSETPVKSPQDAVRLVKELMETFDREAFIIINLHKNGRPINMNICSIGTVDLTLVSPREVLKSVILSNASKIIVMHNHPSGDLSPSQDDYALTKRLSETCQMMGVQVVDHLIVGPSGGFFSFKEHGLLRECLEKQISYVMDKIGERTPKPATSVIGQLQMADAITPPIKKKPPNIDCAR